MHGIQTQGRRMVGADETTELWWPPSVPGNICILTEQSPSWAVEHLAVKFQIGHKVIFRIEFMKVIGITKRTNSWAVVVAQLVEWSFPTAEIHGSNPKYAYTISTVLKRPMLRKKRPGMAHFLKDSLRIARDLPNF